MTILKITIKQINEKQVDVKAEKLTDGNIHTELVANSLLEILSRLQKEGI